MEHNASHRLVVREFLLQLAHGLPKNGFGLIPEGYPAFLALYLARFKPRTDGLADFFGIGEFMLNALEHRLRIRSVGHDTNIISLILDMLDKELLVAAETHCKLPLIPPERNVYAQFQVRRFLCQ